MWLSRHMVSSEYAERGGYRDCSSRPKLMSTLLWNQAQDATEAGPVDLQLGGEALACPLDHDASLRADSKSSCSRDPMDSRQAADLIDVELVGM